MNTCIVCGIEYHPLPPQKPIIEHEGSINIVVRFYSSLDGARKRQVPICPLCLPALFMDCYKKAVEEVVEWEEREAKREAGAGGV